MIGRPAKGQLEDDFKKCIQKHLSRNMLECHVVDKVHTSLLGNQRNLTEMS
jgi:hypothetical protein